jgi:hypothetical protein
MIPMLLIFIAPILQTFISILKIKRVISVPLFLIFAASILLGFILSFKAMGIVNDEMPASRSGMHCGMPGLAVLFAGIFITLITSPIISFVFFLINRSIRRNEIATN